MYCHNTYTGASVSVLISVTVLVLALFRGRPAICIRGGVQYQYCTDKTCKLSESQREGSSLGKHTVTDTGTPVHLYTHHLFSSGLSGSLGDNPIPEWRCWHWLTRISIFLHERLAEVYQADSSQETQANEGQSCSCPLRRLRDCSGENLNWFNNSIEENRRNSLSGPNRQITIMSLVNLLKPG